MRDRMLPGSRLRNIPRAVMASLRRAALGLILGSLCYASLAEADSDPFRQRHPRDHDDLLGMRRAHPQAADQLLEGEAAMHAGDVARAAELFRGAAEQVPESALASRRYCQALTELGRRMDAIRACAQAIRNQSTPMAFRAAVSALMSEPPTPDDLSIALRYAQDSKRRSPDQPWGDAADCDIAERIGDQAMLKQCTDALLRVAPGHYETERRLAASAAPAAKQPLWSLLAWLSLGIAGVITVFHGAWHSGRQWLTRVSARAASTVLAVGLVSFCLPAPARAAAPEPSASAQPAASSASGEGRSIEEPGSLSKWMINEKDPKSSLPNAAQRDKDPLNFGYHMMDLADKAREAADRGDDRAAAKYWEAMAEAVPDVAVGFRRACESWEKARDLQKALENCRKALTVQGVNLNDYDRFARFVLAKEGQLNKEEVQELSDVVAHLRTTEAGVGLAAQIECEVGTRLEDVGRLTSCTTELAKLAPEDARTISFQWVLAIKQGNFNEAQQLIERAKKTDMKPEGIQKMQLATAQEQSLSRRLARNARPIAIAGIVVLALAAAVGISRMLRRRATRLGPAVSG